MKNCKYVLLFIIIMLFGCNVTQPDNKSEVIQLSYIELDQASGFRIDSAFTMVIKDEEYYYSLHSKYWVLFDGSRNKTLPPYVNFLEEMIIGIFWGGGESGCSNISRSINSVYIKNNKIYVDVGPKEFLGPCQMIVYPMYMVRIKKYEYPVEFIGIVPGK